MATLPFLMVEKNDCRAVGVVSIFWFPLRMVPSLSISVAIQKSLWMSNPIYLMFLFPPVYISSGGLRYMCMVPRRNFNHTVKSHPRHYIGEPQTSGGTPDLLIGNIRLSLMFFST